MSREAKERPFDDLRDTPEQIKACLNCTQPECRFSCIPLRYTPGTVRDSNSRLDADGYGEKLFAQGLNDRDVAEIIGASTETVYKWRKKRGIPSAAKRKKAGSISPA